MSLTIQAPHANMNAYEIGDDETRKNKVSDKGTIYAGDLQFAQTTGNAASDKKQSARKQAMKLIREYAARGMDAVNAAGQTSAERLAGQAMDYIRENYSNQDLGLNHICDYLNISTSRFSSIFKEATGRTFTEVLTGVRMERAKQLLRQTSLKNYEIAEKVGFSDPHYFSIAFKKMTGKTPKEYARES